MLRKNRNREVGERVASEKREVRSGRMGSVGIPVHACVRRGKVFRIQFSGKSEKWESEH